MSKRYFFILANLFSIPQILSRSHSHLPLRVWNAFLIRRRMAMHWISFAALLCKSSPQLDWDFVDCRRLFVRKMPKPKIELKHTLNAPARIVFSRVLMVSLFELIFQIHHTYYHLLSSGQSAFFLQALALLRAAIHHILRNVVSLRWFKIECTTLRQKGFYVGFAIFQ